MNNNEDAKILEDKVNDVVNYLIQDTYKEYQFSGFLKFKYLFLLFSLLLI